MKKYYNYKMYPPIACSICCKNLYIDYEIMIEYNKGDSIDSYHKYYVHDKMPEHNLGVCFDALELMQCCRMELMSVINKIPDIYGFNSVDKKTYQS